MLNLLQIVQGGLLWAQKSQPIEKIGRDSDKVLGGRRFFVFMQQIFTLQMTKNFSGFVVDGLSVRSCGVQPTMFSAGWNLKKMMGSQLEDIVGHIRVG